MTETIKPEALKEGDYVEITLRGKVDALPTIREGDGFAYLLFEGGLVATGLSGPELSRATITRIPAPLPPLKVGDRVRIGPGFHIWRLIAPEMMNGTEGFWTAKGSEGVWRATETLNIWERCND